ncbi:MAG TPA: tungsten ABC transporter permease [Hadesarchaea archaeon]|nr:tungsten ABC transporter permease [Hadesarchaea archaeon]
MDRWIGMLIVLTIAAFFALAVIEISIQNEDRLMVATTTSLYDTGLLDVITEQYQTVYGSNLYFLALGSGQSLEHAKRGDADVVLVHAPELENKFLSENIGGARKIIAYNFFAIVGPGDDPAEIENMSPLEAFQKIARTGETWISRGDNSGTHTKEKSLWQAAGLEIERLTDESWYLESGSGMGATLQIANERRAYTLADIGTCLKYRHENLIDLKILVNEGRELLNVYSVMAVNAENHPYLNFQKAVQFIKFLISDEGQGIIGEFGVIDYGRPLFYPAVQLLKENTNPQLASWIREYAFFDNSECPPQYRLGQDELYA